VRNATNSQTSTCCWKRHGSTASKDTGAQPFCKKNLKVAKAPA